MKIILSAFLMTGLMSIQSNAEIRINTYDNYINVSDFSNLESSFKSDEGSLIEKNGIWDILSDITEKEKSNREVAIKFSDDRFENEVRKATGKITGDVYPSDMEKLTSFSPSCFIGNIEGIEYATNLTSFTYSGNCYNGYKLDDISFLENMTNLTELSLYSNDIWDLSPLENLISLTNLNLSSNYIADISVLQNLTKLANLDLSFNYVDISPGTPERLWIDDLIANGVNVDYGYYQYRLKNGFAEEFTLKKGAIAEPIVERCELRSSGKESECSVVSSSFLEYVVFDNSVLAVNNENRLVAIEEGVSKINISYRGYSSDYFNFTNNVVVTTEENIMFSDVEFEKEVRKALNKPRGDVYPSDMEKLTSFSPSCFIGNIEGIEYATNLTSFTYSGNCYNGYKLDDISFLENMTNLTELSLYSNDIWDLSPLENLISLTNLNLSSNYIADISVLQNLTKLANLDLSFNYVDISPGTPERLWIDDLIANGVNVDYGYYQYRLKNGFAEEFTLKKGAIAEPIVERCELRSSGKESECSVISNLYLEYIVADKDVISVSENNSLIAVNEGVTNVQIYYKNLKGGGPSVNFTIAVEPYVYKPTINYSEGGYVSILDNGNNLFIEENVMLEEFNDSGDLKFNFSNSNWSTNNGVMKSESITHSQSTENEIKINAIANQKLLIKLRVSSENKYDWGRVYLNGVEVYEKSGNNLAFDIIELNLIEGENTIKFKYSKDSSGSSGEDAMIVDEIKTYVKIPMDIDKIQYRIDGEGWQTYTKPFTLNKPGGTSVKVEAKTIVTPGVYESRVSEKIVTTISPENLAEKLVEKAESTEEILDLETARNSVNSLPESIKKDELRDRLDAIFPNIEMELNTVTSNLDIYIKSENMLSLSLDTNSVTFEDFSGVDDMEKLNTVNLTINSSLPYQVNAYLVNEIQNADKSNTMNKEILNIKANSELSYNTFNDTVTPIVLLDDQIKGNDISHGIDIKLKGNIAHKKGAYKTTIRFEVNQK